MNSEDNSGVGQFLLCQTEDGKSRVECRFSEESLWPSQALLPELYGRSKKTISEHINNIFGEGELSPESVVRKYRTTRLRLLLLEGRSRLQQKISHQMVQTFYLAYPIRDAVRLKLS